MLHIRYTVRSKSFLKFSSNRYWDANNIRKALVQSPRLSLLVYSLNDIVCSHYKNQLKRCLMLSCGNNSKSILIISILFIVTYNSKSKLLWIPMKKLNELFIWNVQCSTYDSKWGNFDVQLRNGGRRRGTGDVCYFEKRFIGSFFNFKSAKFIYFIQDQNQLILFLLEWVSRTHEHLYTVNNTNRYKCVKIWTLNLEHLRCWTF